VPVSILLILEWPKKREDVVIAIENTAMFQSFLFWNGLKNT